jgi:hypothetical protein
VERGANINNLKRRSAMKRLLVLFSIVLLVVPFAAVAQDFCKGDFDYDNDVDGSDASIFKSYFGRSGFSNPCPDDGPAPVTKTGQTICYDNEGNIIDCAGTGQDGEYKKGVAWPNPRFTDNGNGTVTDNLTGLIWLQDANCFGERTWNNALSDSNGLANGTCGLADGSSAGDWRLPNRFELESLLDLSKYGMAIPSWEHFNNPGSYYYWSSTTNAIVTNYAWLILMYSGSTEYGLKTDIYRVWPVRGGH